jgi:hypothetical protein
MRRLKNRRVVHCAGAVLALVLALALPALVAAAGVPAGPRLTLVIDRAKTLSNELEALGPNGESVQAYPSSVAPNGELVATILGRGGFSVGMVDPRTGTVRQITQPTIDSEGVLEPAISPDGEEIVYKTDDIKRSPHGAPEGLRATELMVVPAAGGAPKRLTRVPGGARWPSWDPSGSRIAFTTLNATGVSDWDNNAQPGNALIEVNADGTCLTEIYSLGKAGRVQGVGWQPGAGRGAEPISC